MPHAWICSLSTNVCLSLGGCCMSISSKLLEIVAGQRKFSRDVVATEFDTVFPEQCEIVPDSVDKRGWEGWWFGAETADVGEMVWKIASRAGLRPSNTQQIATTKIKFKHSRSRRSWWCHILSSSSRLSSVVLCYKGQRGGVLLILLPARLF